jgi:hypothetical protein
MSRILEPRALRGANISTCGTYRWRLWREDSTGSRTVLFVMLNPSTADACVDDPTIRRCIGFQRRWGFRRLEVVNLFALRATNPAELITHEYPTGIGNHEWIGDAARAATQIVCAWGAVHPKLQYRVDSVLRYLRGRELFCLGQNQDGSPKHPLYLPAVARPVHWNPSPQSGDNAPNENGVLDGPS